MKTPPFQLIPLSEAERRKLSRTNTKEREERSKPNSKKSKSSIREKFFDPNYICHESYKTKKHKKVEYINLSAAFDIETTSFKENGLKRGTMYAFVFGVNGKVVFGRTWKDFTDVLQQLKKNYGLSENKILPVYVHNLSFEFQFICKRLK